MCKNSIRKNFRNVLRHIRSKKDVGMSLAPWVLLYFFIAIFILLLFFMHNLHISTKYVVEDALASAALAGEVVDLDVFSQYQELVITDLDYTRDVFEESIQTSLNLDQEGYPLHDSAYFEESVPIQIMELHVYNVTDGAVYQTDLLRESGKLQYQAQEGLLSDNRCILLGDLADDAGMYQHVVTMLDGEKKLIKNTSLYASICFGVPGYNGTTIMLEKDILTDIQIND